MKNNINLILASLLTLFFLNSCGELLKNNSIKKSEVKTKWVYIEIESIIKKDTTAGYIYGKVDESVIENLENKELYSIFKVSDVRFFNDDDKFQLYEDEDESGILFYRIGSIKKLSVYKRDPIYSFETKQLHKSTLELLK
ncbi:MAG: hypothetical protein AB8B78_05835 [Polaribacter sp.]